MRTHRSRRSWLRDLARGSACAAIGTHALAVSRAAAAAPPWRPEASTLEIDLPQLRWAGAWNPRPGAMRELALELRMRTRLQPRPEPSTVELDSADLFSTPFLYVASATALPEWTDRGVAALARLVGLGGMLVLDDASGGTDRGFRGRAHALVERILPGHTLQALGAEHVLYRSFYLIDRAVGRTATAERDLAVVDEGRIKVLYLPNDLGGALARDDRGAFRWSCVPGGESQREWAIRCAINIVLYATCTDYKSDPAHVETLLRRGRGP